MILVSLVYSPGGCRLELGDLAVQVARCESSAAAARQVLRAARDELGLAAAKAFARIDQDGSGTLDKGELKELCRELGIGEAQTA